MYGACRHRPRFQRHLTTYCAKIYSNDGKQKGLERVANCDSFYFQGDWYLISAICSTNLNTDIIL